ncbi:MAG: ABC transporter substrate-binding protein [Prochlorococcaceae cyanobacterium]
MSPAPSVSVATASRRTQQASPGARLLVPALLTLLLPLLASCQPPHSPTRLVVATKSRIDSLDPAKASRVGTMQVLSALGDPLYAIRADGQIEPRLATALPQLSPDGRTARIPLRRGVLFHDGTRFDAEALVFSLKRFMAIGTLAYQLSDRVQEARAVDSHTVELKLRQPFTPLPRLLSAIFLTPISPTAYRSHADKALNERFVGTGPYRLAHFSGQQVRLTPWERYWGPRPANEGIDLVNLSNSTSLFGALRSGEVDVLLSSGLEIDHEQALHREALRGRLHEARGPALSIGFLSLLTDEPPLDNPTLRQAIARSLDRQTLSRRVSLGLRPPLRQLVPPGLPGSDPNAWPAYDPAEARRLFRQAGYCNGRVFSLPLTFRSDIPSDRLFALTWQAQLRRDLRDCVTLEASGMESTTAYDQLAKGALVLFFYDWIGDYPDAENFLAPLLSCQEPRGSRCAKGNSALSGSFWTAPGLDAELVRSSQLEGAERIALLQAIQRRTAAAVPYLPVWLMEEGAWSGAGVSPPRFDGSGRVQLEALHRLGQERGQQRGQEQKR